MPTDVTSSLKFGETGVMDAQAAAANSTLNPSAPYFFPSAFLEVEDFSSEWWCLVQTSPAFRDYWMNERMEYMDEEEFTTEDFDQLDTFMELIDQEPGHVSQDETFIQKVHATDCDGVSKQEELQKQLLVNSMERLDLEVHTPADMQKHA